MKSSLFSARMVLAAFIAINIVGCQTSGNQPPTDSKAPKKVKTTEQLLLALKKGFNERTIDKPEFYLREIGYVFKKLPINANNPEEFFYGTGEAIPMDAGEFEGRLISVKKHITDSNARVVNVEFETPGCFTKSQVERIFEMPFTRLEESRIYGLQPRNRPLPHKIGATRKSIDYSIYISTGAEDGCVLDVNAVTVYR